MSKRQYAQDGCVFEISTQDFGSILKARCELIGYKGQTIPYNDDSHLGWWVVRKEPNGSSQDTKEG